MSQEVVVRLATADDAEAFRALRLEALANHPEAFSADYATNAAQPSEHWKERLSSSERAATLVAEDDGRLIGMTGIYRHDSPKVEHLATIWGVYVQRESRRRGVADRLLTACLDWARDQGVERVRLAVNTRNLSAIRCYARLGFAVWGIEPAAIKYEGKYWDEIWMGREV